MTHLIEPRAAADMDGELTTLIRRWMAAGTKVQERVRRDSALRPAPEPVEAEPAEPVEPAETADVDAPTEPEPEDGRADEPETAALVPALPRRSTGADAEQVHRVALLIDARRVPADVATALLARMGERGSVNICRAYADWSRSDLGDWVTQLRREGLHSFHHFSDDDDQALVAMTIDAVDIARDAAVDEVVIAGDLTSALPLVHRLHAAGVRVVVVGPGHTPHDVRAACHEFIDTASVDGAPAVPAGRHRA
ncbi:NYN domain-containing protein [Nocardioides sp.]|uniref:NYN domain-containing protein n=1 Tax=Nocardioides sp. TaxID=35761 RepID=UPI002623B658|nr:NYN domain-containing protein [Nocardioides sp.]MCW2736386.1 hypothetical protein [Nocardioides sp.]